MAGGNQNEPAPWEQRKPPQPAYTPPPPQPPQAGYPPAYQQPGAAYPQTIQPYSGPGYGQNPMYGQQAYPPVYGQQAYTQPFGGQQVGYCKPHRATACLVLAIITWFLGCPVTGFIAFFMAKKDLEEMNAGQMDPSGKSLTQVAYWIGIVVASLQTFIYFVYFLLIIVMIATHP